jgi:hypothetical protein
MLNFVKGLSFINWDDNVILSLILLSCPITFINLPMLNHPCIPGMKPTWSWCMIFLMYCWIQLASSYFMEDFCVCVYQGNWSIGPSPPSIPPSLCSFLLSLLLFCPYSGIRVILASQNEFGSIPNLFILWDSLRNIGVSSLMIW